MTMKTCDDRKPVGFPSIHLLQGQQIVDTLFHYALAEQRIEIRHQRSYFVADKRQIETFKLTENLRRKNIVDAFRLVSAARDVNGYETFQLFHYTVTERYAEFI